MKKYILSIIFVGLLVSVARSDIILNDGATHNIDYHSGAVGYVIVEDNFWSESTTANLLSGGYINGSFTAKENSKVNILGGEIRWMVTSTDNSNLHISGGIVGDGVRVNGQGLTLISGGYINDELWSLSVGQLQITGGHIGGEILINGSGQVKISGGEFDNRISISDSANVVFEALNCTLDGHSVTGLITNPLSQPNQGHLIGLILDGSQLDIQLNLAGNASVMLIPEPVSLSFLILGTLFLKRERRNN